MATKKRSMNGNVRRRSNRRAAPKPKTTKKKDTVDTTTPAIGEVGPGDNPRFSTPVQNPPSQPATGRVGGGNNSRVRRPNTSRGGTTPRPTRSQEGRPGAGAGMPNRTGAGELFLQGGREGLFQGISNTYPGLMPQRRGVQMGGPIGAMVNQGQRDPLANLLEGFDRGDIDDATFANGFRQQLGQRRRGGGGGFGGGGYYG